MRTAVVYESFSRKDKVESVVKGLVTGLEEQGATVDCINLALDRDKKLTSYSYIAFGISGPSGFSGKLPPTIISYLKNAGHLVGKRSFAFVLKQPLFSQKLLSSLMRAMESEGMFVKYSEILSSTLEGKVVAKRLVLDKG